MTYIGNGDHRIPSSSDVILTECPAYVIDNEEFVVSHCPAYETIPAQTATTDSKEPEYVPMT